MNASTAPDPGSASPNRLATAVATAAAKVSIVTPQRWPSDFR